MTTTTHTQPSLPLALYGRVSREGARVREGSSYHSKVEQRSDGERIAREWNLPTLPEVFMDANVSGGTLDRKGLNRVLALIRGGQCGGIIVTRLDRISRADLYPALGLLHEIEQAGGVIYTSRGPVTLTGPEAILTILELWQAGQYLADRRDSGAKARRRSIIENQAHLWVTFGYQREGNGSKRLVPLEPEASVVVKAYELRAAGHSWHHIADLLNADGILPRPKRRRADEEPRQALWTHKTVRQLVQKRVYLGEARSGEYVLEDAHQALVSADLWRRANEARPTQRRPPHGSNRPGYLLSGLVRCAGCGYVMVHSVSNGHGYYRCSQRRGGSAGACPAAANIPARALDAHMARVFAEQVFGQVETALVETRADLEPLRQAELEAQAEVEATHALVIRRELAGAKPGSLDHLIDQAEARAKAAAEARQAAEHQARGLDLPQGLTEAGWSQATVAQQRHWMSLVVAFVRVFPTPKGVWRPDLTTRIEVVGRDEVDADGSWIEAGRAA